MKRGDLIRHLEDSGCVLFREGKKHSIFYNNKSGKTSSVPRHREVNGFLADKICKDLGIDSPRRK